LDRRKHGPVRAARVQYHRIVKRRCGLLVAALTIWLGAGPLVVDQCLLGCHHNAPAAASPSAPSCHETDRRHSGALWQATTVCGHDHSQPSAETAVKPTSESPLKIAPAPPASEHHTTFRASMATSTASPPPPGGATAAAFSRPLRL
jgi:hypothetical protein